MAGPSPSPSNYENQVEAMCYPIVHTRRPEDPQGDYSSTISWHQVGIQVVKILRSVMILYLAVSERATRWVAAPLESILHQRRLLNFLVGSFLKII